MSVSRALLAVTALLLPFLVNAGGVGLGATRLVYPAGEKQVSLNVRNTHETSPFLIQAWLDNASNVKTADFVVAPPLSILRPKAENTLRIMFAGQKLPQDRETLYWMTVKAIPQSAVTEQNTLQLAAASRIKVFYRPANLPVSPAEASKQLTGTLRDGKVTMNNPTPYYITLSSLKIDGKKVNPIMIAPKSNITLTETYSMAKKIEYQTVDDYGAWTAATIINIK